jgi:hypothetical protein
MAKYQFSDIERMAILLAHKRRCAHCDDPIMRFKDLEIDHALPESLLSNPDELEKIKVEYGLGSEFEINSYYNWVPSCIKCNRRKSNRRLSKQYIFNLLELVAKPKHERIARIERKLEKIMKKEGFLTHIEAVRFIKTETLPLIEESLKDFVVNNLILAPATERRDQWINEYLSKAVQTIAEKATPSVIENLSTNEPFLTVVLQATSIALRNHQKEKLEALRNAVVNSVLPSSADDDIKLMFLDLVDELKVSHLRLLRMLYEPDKYSNEENNFLNELEKHKHLYCHFPNQLIAHNLISLGAFYNSADAIVEEENNYRFPLPAPVPYPRITSSGVPIVRYSSYSQEKRMNIKLREMERTSRNIDLVIQVIRGNKSKDCITEFGSLFIQFIQSSVGDS